jgi:hypothetical protein
MSKNRNQDRDRATTLRVILGQHPENDGTIIRGREVNWLGHGMNTGAASMDRMLLTGATVAGLAEARDVETHLNHLRTEHGLPIVNVDGVVIFDQAAL